MASDKGLVHVIDDDEASRQSLAFLLQTAKIDVQTHVSAAIFLDQLPDLSACCIVTDVRMPGLSGIDLLRRLRELNVTAPVIVMTGHGDVSACGRGDEDRRGGFLREALRRRGAAGKRPFGAATAGGREKARHGARRDRQQDCGIVQPRTRRSCRPGGRPRQQADRLSISASARARSKFTGQIS